MTGPPASLRGLLARIRRCEECRAHLPLGPRPIVVADARARILIVGQAPGRRVHESGVPWDDPSGDRLREWLGVDARTFYDPRLFAIVPMGFCYPGTTSSGDAPPRPECAPLWHGPLLERLPAVELTLLLSRYAHEAYLGERRKATLTETVRAFRDYTPRRLPLPHPSPRNNRWLKQNPWFQAEVLPWLRRRVRRVLRDAEPF
jgi:uracil-DNA glycosylase